MKIRLFLLLIFLLYIPMFLFSQKKVSFDGVTYEIVDNAEDFVNGYKKGIPTVIKFTGKYYVELSKKIINSATNMKIDYQVVYDPSKVVYVKNNHVLSLYEVLNLSGIKENSRFIIGGNKSDHEIDYENGKFYFLTNILPIKKIEEDKLYVKKYFKYLAKLWWSDQDPEARFSPELKPGSKICDATNKEVRYGEGYIYGYIEKGILYSSRLFCDEYMEIFITNYFETFEDSLILKAREYNDSLK